MLEEKGVPGIVERTLIRPPSSKLGPISDDARRAAMQASPVAGKYEALVDRKSAYEILKDRADQAAKGAAEAEVKAEEKSVAEREFNAGRRYSGKRVDRSSAQTRGGMGAKFGRAAADAVLKELKGTTGRRLVRGILGGLFKGR